MLFTVYVTEWPVLCWCADVKKLLTHSLDSRRGWVGWDFEVGSCFPLSLVVSRTLRYQYTRRALPSLQRRCTWQSPGVRCDLDRLPATQNLTSWSDLILMLVVVGPRSFFTSFECPTRCRHRDASWTLRLYRLRQYETTANSSVTRLCYWRSIYECPVLTCIYKRTYI